MITGWCECCDSAAAIDICAHGSLVCGGCFESCQRIYPEQYTGE